jgi:hypothetical protein
VSREKIGGAEAEPFNRSGGGVLYEYVCPGDEPAREIHPCGRLQVQRHRFLAPVEPDEM